MSAPVRLARVEKRRQLSARVSELVLLVPGEPRFHWASGQYVIVHAGDERLAYSIANADHGEFPPEFALAIGDGSGAELLMHTGPGSDLSIEGPFGSFTLGKAPAGLFIGVGTGSAPLRALVQAALMRGGGGPFVLLSGNRWESEVLWRDEFEAQAATDARFRFEPTLTRPEPTWRGRVGRVQDHLADIVPELGSDFEVYVCGKTEMVQSTKQRLFELGVQEAQIESESY
jgi:NAD(P)H-flavin reductase